MCVKPPVRATDLHLDPTPGDKEQHWLLLLPLYLQWFARTHFWMQSKALRCLVHPHPPVQRTQLCSDARTDSRLEQRLNPTRCSLTKASPEGKNYTQEGRAALREICSMAKHRSPLPALPGIPQLPLPTFPLLVPQGRGQTHLSFPYPQVGR